MSIIIRPGRTSDGPQMMKIWKEGLDYHAALSKSDFALDEDAPLLWLRFYEQNLKQKNAKLLVAEKNGIIIGYLLGQVHRRPRFFKTKECGFIGELVVAEKERGKSVGKRLLNAYIEWASRKGLPYINIFVDYQNRKGLNFWKKAGFETVMLEQRKILDRD